MSTKHLNPSALFSKRIFLIVFLLISLGSEFSKAQSKCADIFTQPIRTIPITDVRAFISELTKAAEDAEAQSYQTRDFLRDAEPRKQQSLSKILLGEGAYLSKEELPLDQAWKIPQAVVLGGSPRYSGKGGLVTWKNDVFPSDFFVRHHDKPTKKQGVKIDNLFTDLESQPWFQWKNSAFSFKTSGASARILDLLLASQKNSRTVTVYRGTTRYEALLLNLNRQLTSNTFPHDWREQLKLAFNEIANHAYESLKANEQLDTEFPGTFLKDIAIQRRSLERTLKLGKTLARLQAQAGSSPDQVRETISASLFLLLKQGTFYGLFTTPDRNRAAEFSKGEVVELRLSAEQLKKLLQVGNAYIGFESFEISKGVFSPSIEIALFAKGNEKSISETMDIILDSFVKAEPHVPSQIFN